jgi:hypothetical protein
MTKAFPFATDVTYSRKLVMENLGRKGFRCSISQKISHTGSLRKV